MATKTNQTKPAPAKNGSAQTAQEPDDDVTDDDLDAPIPTASGKAAFKALSPAKRVAVRIGNAVARLEQHLSKVGRWPDEHGVADAHHKFAAGVTLLKTAAEGLARVPDAWVPRPTPAAKQSSELAAGSKIRITDKKKSEYEGVLDDDQMRNIEVIEVRGTKVVCKTPDGTRAMLARGHVCLDA